MEAHFYSVSTECRRYLFIPDSFDSSVLRAALTKWERDLKKIDDEYILEFIEQHQQELNRVKSVLLQVTRLTPEIRGFHDRIFKNILRIERFQHAITHIFGEFIKGITYFDYQKTDPRDIPVYHRLFACGPGDGAFRKAYSQCTSDMSKDRRRDIRKRIETCYLERLIFDHMFKNQTLYFPSGNESPSQEKGHAYRLEETQNDFRSCFPNLSFEVDIEYDGMWPVKLTVVRHIRGTVASIETYARYLHILTNGLRKYDEFVDCTRKTDGGLYFAISRFTAPSGWKRLEHAH